MKRDWTHKGFHTIEQLADDPALFAYAKDAFARGRAEGSLLELPEPAGGEFCAYMVIDGAFAGFVTAYHPDADQFGLFWLDLIWVEPQWRGTGIGNILLGAVLSQAKAKGMARVQLGTGWDNRSMQRLCRRWKGKKAVMIFDFPIAPAVITSGD